MVVKTIGKKADWFMDNWAEFIGFIFLIIGFIIAISAGSAFIVYIISVLYGSAFGRWWYRFKGKLKAAVAVVILGGLIGLTLGSVYGRREIVILLFILGFIASYQLHERKIIHSAEM